MEYLRWLGRNGQLVCIETTHPAGNGWWVTIEDHKSDLYWLKHYESIDDLDNGRIERLSIVYNELMGGTGVVGPLPLDKGGNLTLTKKDE